MRCVLALLSVLSLAAAQPIQPRALPFIGTGTLTVAAFNATTQTFINSGCVDSSGKWAVLSQLCATFNGELWHYATTPSLSYINLTSTATTTSTASNGSIKTTTIKNPCGVRKLGADAVPTFVCANDLVADKYGDSGYWSVSSNQYSLYVLKLKTLEWQCLDFIPVQRSR